MLTEDGKQYHIRCKEGEVGRYVLLPGDPFRTDVIASYFDDAKLIAHNREHKTWTVLGSAPVSRRMACTALTKFGCLNSRELILTAKVRCTISVCAAQSTSCAHAASNTHWSILRISPVSLAWGINSLG